ncbi:DUF4767 domain-containing protein [Lactobacillus sp. CBA3605]|uniref:DUF4767 domain-containing protein n=1 Tax=Lactobacillus sp. CBA3605 TaxID=2099788 RepID=UPI000CFC1DCD|nr:DUF4767 domain-containing protein [Lactobacillus sp. CBA3605]AVK62075.1 DUF4767 domain-containing protein [Lactobacillus sp. CBA3605]
MKKIKVLMLVVVSLLSGCAARPNQAVPKVSSSQSTAATNSRPTSKKVASKKSSSAVVASSSSEMEANTLWNQTKTQRLAKFMHQWEVEMGQSYTGTYDGDHPDHLGFVFPTTITTGQLKDRVKWGQRAINLTWSKNGENGAEFQVVAVATGGKATAEWPTTYFFCLHHQRPVVFMTQTTNGDDLYLKDTQNSALQAGFTEIVTGSRPTVQDSATLNADVSAAVQAKPQRWPSNYQGTWYYYEAYTKRVETVENTRISEAKLNYFDTVTPKFINVLGATQTAGDGEFDYVRYQYYDGRQIPVMMMASGADMWFDNNAYRDKAIAAQLRGLQFGDETASR